MPQLNMEIIILAFGAFSNFLGIVWAAAKITAKLESVKTSTEQLWSKVSELEAGMIESKSKIAVLLDRSNRDYMDKNKEL